MEPEYQFFSPAVLTTTPEYQFFSLAVLTTGSQYQFFSLAVLTRGSQYQFFSPPVLTTGSRYQFFSPVVLTTGPEYQFFQSCRLNNGTRVPVSTVSVVAPTGTPPSPHPSPLAMWDSNPGLPLSRRTPSPSATEADGRRRDRFQP